MRQKVRLTTLKLDKEMPSAAGGVIAQNGSCLRVGREAVRNE
jgi:hypothetical protein